MTTAEKTAFLLGEQAKLQPRFRRVIQQLRDEYGISPASVDPSDDSELDRIFADRQRDWVRSHPDRADSFRARCAREAHYL